MHGGVMTRDARTADQQTPYRLLERDARLLVGVLATLTGSSLGDEDNPTLRRVRERLARDGALDDAEHRGEATAILGDLCQQLRYCRGEYDDERPGPEERVWTHQLRFPDEASARACADELRERAPLGVEVVREDDGFWVHVVHADLPPDAGFEQRQTDLQELAERHGGRLDGAAGGRMDRRA